MERMEMGESGEDGRKRKSTYLAVEEAEEHRHCESLEVERKWK